MLKWTDLLDEFEKWHLKTYRKDTPKPKIIKNYFINKIFKRQEYSTTVDGKNIKGWRGFKFNGIELKDKIDLDC